MTDQKPHNWDILSASAHSPEVLSAFVNELSFWEPDSNLQPKQQQQQRRSSHKKASSRQGLRQRTSSDHLSTRSSSRSRSSSPLADMEEPVHWKIAVDPVSGRKYFYDTITRQTQWEKPPELRQWEKHLKREQKKKDNAFFRCMEDNIRSSLDRKELMPGLETTDDITSGLGPPQEPTLEPPQQLRVRTISAMNEHLLAEINLDASASEGESSFSLSSLDVSSSNPSSSTSSITKPSLVDRASSTASVPLVKGSRPPLPKARNMAVPETRDSLELSPEQTDADAASVTTKFVRESSELSLPDESSLAGEYLLDGTGSSGPVPVVAVLAPKGALRPEMPTNTIKPAATALAPLAHVRRNTGGTMYVQSTMDNPDVNATIKCVCGVFRAHIVQSANRKTTHSPVSVNTATINLELFRDDYEDARLKNKDGSVPTLAVIESFYLEFYNRSQLEHDTIIMSLVYVERLIKETNGALTPSPENWRSVLFSCMILASKVWDDLSMWNIDFSNVSNASGLSSFSLQRINQLELALLTSLGFSVKVPASEYAKYYFLIRTMLSRSGLLGNAVLPLNPAEAKKLETRTTQYEVTQLSGRGGDGRRARSVDWSCYAEAASNDGPPAPAGSAGPEQLVSMGQH